MVPQFDIFVVTEEDGTKKKVATPQLCLFKDRRVDCREQAMCKHGYCGHHCWVRQCKAKRQRVQGPSAPSEADLPVAQDDLLDGEPVPPMDTTGDAKAQPMASSPDNVSSELKGCARFYLSDLRPEYKLDSDEAQYIAWLNGLRLVTARQSGDTVSMILPGQKGSLAVR